MSPAVFVKQRRGMLKGIDERTQIEKRENRELPTRRTAVKPGYSFPEDTVVSMNFWGFTPPFTKELERDFVRFFERMFPKIH